MLTTKKAVAMLGLGFFAQCAGNLNSHEWSNCGLTRHQKNTDMRVPTGGFDVCGGMVANTLEDCEVVRKETFSQKTELDTFTKGVAAKFNIGPSGRIYIDTEKGCSGIGNEVFFVHLQPPWGLFGTLCRLKRKCPEDLSLLRNGNDTFLLGYGAGFNITDWNKDNPLSQGQLTLFKLSSNQSTLELGVIPEGLYGVRHTANLGFFHDYLKYTIKTEISYHDARFRYSEAEVNCLALTCNKRPSKMSHSSEVKKGVGDEDKREGSSVALVAAGAVGGGLALLFLCLCAVKIREDLARRRNLH